MEEIMLKLNELYIEIVERSDDKKRHMTLDAIDCCVMEINNVIRNYKKTDSIYCYSLLPPGSVASRKDLSVKDLKFKKNYTISGYVNPLKKGFTTIKGISVKTGKLIT